MGDQFSQAFYIYHDLAKFCENVKKLILNHSSPWKKYWMILFLLFVFAQLQVQ